MRIGTVIGRVTLSVRHPLLKGERLMLVQPWTSKSIGTEGPHGASVVVYDELGANSGQLIGISEGAEAMRPFVKEIPIDAYCGCLIDHTFYQAQEPGI